MKIFAPIIQKTKVSRPVNTSAMPPFPKEIQYLYSVGLPKLKKVILPTALGAACAGAGYVYTQNPDDSEKAAENLASNLDEYKEKESSQISKAISHFSSAVGFRGKNNNTTNDVQKEGENQ